MKIDSLTRSEEVEFSNAVFRGNIETVKRYLDDGVSIETRNEKSGLGSSDTTILMMAREQGQAEMVEFLIEKGADIHAKQEHEYTALQLAVCEGKTKVAKLLVNHGADVNYMNTYNNHSVLMMARSARRCTKELEDFLIESGAK